MYVIQRAARALETLNKASKRADGAARGRSIGGFGFRPRERACTRRRPRPTREASLLSARNPTGFRLISNRLPALTPRAARSFTRSETSARVDDETGHITSASANWRGVARARRTAIFRSYGSVYGPHTRSRYVATSHVTNCRTGEIARATETRLA